MLTERQKHMLDYMDRFIRDHNYPPSIRQLQLGAHISSTSVVKYNLEKLRAQKLIEHDRHVSRGLRITEAGREALAGVRGEDYQPSPQPMTIWSAPLVRIPLLGRIAAGEPLPVPGSDFSLMSDRAVLLTGDIIKEQEGLYALEVRGESMIDALINDGDTVVMKHAKEAHNGEMVAVWLKDREETTLKHFYLEGGRVRLQPANPTMKPIYVDAANVEIQGRVVAVIRQLQ